MSDYTPGDWCDVWDSLFWNFIRQHQDVLGKNPRMAILMGYLKNDSKIKEHSERAQLYVKKLKSEDEK